MQITKEQEEEFKRRKLAGNKISNEEFENYHNQKPELTSVEFLSFLKATDEKCE